MVHKDIFSDMLARIGCRYISDLPYFNFEAYGEYLDDNGTFVETDHGIYELP